jgi:hypothetical protein
MPDIVVRNVEPDALKRFRMRARARAMTQGNYLAALVDLHDRMRALADHGAPAGLRRSIADELEALGLSTLET